MKKKKKLARLPEEMIFVSRRNRVHENKKKRKKKWRPTRDDFFIKDDKFSLSYHPLFFCKNFLKLSTI